ncbi:MAG: histidine kinase [Chloroflexi bacterium HGW-Chloroflexi-8]|nr:MAG: histidine kinase [Chloroflexi bacterium HGW-Chloroflexi-8]
MLKPLRLKLTLLYLLVAMLLAGLVGFSAYSLLYYYFQNNNDGALKFKMASTFTTIGVGLPPDLLEAEQNWINIRTNENKSSEANETIEEPGEDHEEIATESTTGSVIPIIRSVYEGELTSIFIMPLDETGRLIFNPNPYVLPMNPDLSAVQSALTAGHDLRNSTLKDGTPVRLLTYNVPDASGYGLLQMGKPIDDQMRVLNQFVSGLLLVGAISILVLGFGSWWMAGRSLRATQNAWDMQQAFVANASHELRTPLTLMRASAEVAQRSTQPNPQQAALMTNIVEEVDHMSQLVDELLLLSRLDAHQLKLDIRPIQIAGLVAEIQRQFEPLMSAKQVTFLNQTTAGTVQADVTRLRQVLIILLDNALRHTPPGGTISVRSLVEGRNLRITVDDNGEGIAPEHLPHVFDRFYQADNARSKDQKGTGLGLSIAKSLVEIQAGQISITSQLGKGTSISITLPKQ